MYVSNGYGSRLESVSEIPVLSTGLQKLRLSHILFCASWNTGTRLGYSLKDVAVNTADPFLYLRTLPEYLEFSLFFFFFFQLF